MFTPWITVAAWLKERTPSSLKALAPHANFITLHCMHAKVGMSGSVWLTDG